MVRIILFIQRINPCVPQNNKNTLFTAVSNAAFVFRYLRTKLVCKIFSFSLTDGRNKILGRVMFAAETFSAFSDPVASKLMQKIPNFSRFTLSSCIRWRGRISSRFERTERTSDWFTELAKEISAVSSSSPICSPKIGGGIVRRFLTVLRVCPFHCLVFHDYFFSMVFYHSIYTASTKLTQKLSVCNFHDFF